eukprot:4912881-Lingulodinium_polyedra.AAC.1
MLNATFSLPLEALGPWSRSTRERLQWIGVPALAQPRPGGAGAGPEGLDAAGRELTPGQLEAVREA